MSYNITKFHRRQAEKPSLEMCYHILMKKAGFILIVLILLFIINGLAHSIYDLWHKQDLVTSAQKQLSEEKLQNQKLKAGLSYVKTQQFIEEQAHDKLFLVKPGEQEVLISKTLQNQNQVQKQAQNTPNWQKWFQLFF
jgi:cell division protein FtsB